MQTDTDTSHRRRIFSLCVIAVGCIVGVLAAFFVHHAGRSLFASLFAGVFCGVLGAVSAFLFLLAAFRIVWIFRYSRHTKNQL